MEDLGARIAAAPLPGHPHGADRLVLGAAAGTGDAGDRHRDGRAGMHQRAADHFHHGLAADRAVHFQRVRVDAEHRLLGLVAVHRHAAVEPGRGAGHIGHRLGDPAAGAAFRGHQHLPRSQQAFASGVRQHAEFGIGGNDRHRRFVAGSAGVVAHGAAKQNRPGCPGRFDLSCLSVPPAQGDTITAWLAKESVPRTRL